MERWQGSASTISAKGVAIVTMLMAGQAWAAADAGAQPSDVRGPLLIAAGATTADYDGSRPAAAEEWQYLLSGTIRATLFGSRGRYREATLNVGDVGYIPQGYGHSLENVGSEPAKILIVFNSGTYETVDVSQWIAGQPADVLAVNFGKPATTFEVFPKRDVFITKG